MESEDEIAEKQLSNAIDSDEDENEPVVTTNKKKRRAILDDSDSDDDAPNQENEDSDHESPKKQAAIVDSDSDESDSGPSAEVDDDDSDTEQMSADNKSSKEAENGDDDFSKTCKDTAANGSFMKNDLFDAEMDSDDDDNDDKKSNHDDTSDSGVLTTDDEDGPSKPFPSISDDDGNGQDDEEMSASLKKRLKKGAGKKESTPRSGASQRRKIVDLTDVHSETQRLVRESAVKLPYHKPEKEKLSLSVFLARTKQKQEQLNSIKQPCLAWKQTPEILPKQNKDGSLLKRAEASLAKQKSKSPETKTDTAEDKKNHSCELVKKDIMEDLEKAVEEDWDNLPDLVMEKKQTKVQYEVVTEEEAAIEEKIQLDVKETVNQSDLKDTIPEQESGYISVPTSEEENSGDHDKNQHVDTPVKSETKSENVEKVKTETLLTPKLASLTVDKFTPKLSGAPDSFIDFEDEDSLPSAKKLTPQPGLMKLMERVVKHSSKKTRRKSVDMEISVVSKESSVSNDREELSLQKVIYHVHEEDSKDEVSKKPGARLLTLKEKLQQQMRQKRADARQKREAQHAYDNEEGFDVADDEDAVLDDDAEMTDQTDTDDDRDEEDIIDEEDLLGGHGDENEEEENNPFVDNEAEDEDEEEEEEDMEEDDESLPAKSDQISSDVSPKANKDFIKAALKKQKTLDLFDEDAVDDSPTLSQNVDKNEQGVELSLRPFQQISGTLGAQDDTEADQDDILLLDTQPIKEPSSRDTSALSADSSFEMMSSLIPAGQRSGQKSQGRNLLTPDLFNGSSKASSGLNPQKTPSHVTDTLDDLLVQESPEKSDERRTLPKFDFQIEETQSLMLDDEGLIKVRSEKKAPRKLLLDSATRGSSSQGTEDELLALCSGNFTVEDSQQAGHKSQASKSLFCLSESESAFPCTQVNTQANYNELLGLCSGQFTGKFQEPSQRPAVTTATQKEARVDSEEAEILKSLQAGTAPFNVVSEGGSKQQPDNKPSPSQKKKSTKKRKRAVIQDEDSNDFTVVAGGEDAMDGQLGHSDADSDGGDAEDAGGSDDEEVQQARQFAGLVTSKTRKLRKEFVDEEAELSGSEYDSDENFDIAERDDVLELEEGDMDDVGTNEDLRNQVGKVHLKSLIDADKKELRLFQEMYLQDGDMHSDGQGRQRKFRWRNIDEDTQQDMFKSDEEDEDEDNGEESSWRLKRHEREKFLQEQSNQDIDDTDSNSQFIKLGRVAFRKKIDSNSSSMMFSMEDSSQSMQSQGPKVLPKTDSKENFAKPKLPSHGSFLRRGRDSLAKLAEMTKPVSTMGGARNSGKFVFSAKSPDPKDNKEQKRPQVKRSISTNQQQPNKRQKVERSNSLPQSSIFNLM